MLHALACGLAQQGVRPTTVTYPADPPAELLSEAQLDYAGGLRLSYYALPQLSHAAARSAWRLLTVGNVTLVALGGRYEASPSGALSADLALLAELMRKACGGCILADPLPAHYPTATGDLLGPRRSSAPYWEAADMVLGAGGQAYKCAAHSVPGAWRADVAAAAAAAAGLPLLRLSDFMQPRFDAHQARPLPARGVLPPCQRTS